MEPFPSTNSEVPVAAFDSIAQEASCPVFQQECHVYRQGLSYTMNGPAEKFSGRLSQLLNACVGPAISQAGARPCSAIQSGEVLNQCNRAGRDLKGGRTDRHFQRLCERGGQASLILSVVQILS